MRLAQLFSIFPQLKWGDAATKDVSSLCFDSRLLEKNCVFVAIRGGQHDGHNFLAAAMEKGAIALVVEDEGRVPAGFTGAVALVSDSRAVLNRLAARWYGEPATRLFCAGVTGTNGKTTTTYMIEAVLQAFGWATGVIGTINHHLGEHVWATDKTTPDPLSFQRRLHEFETLGAQAVTLEVSSHALRQSRVDEVPFDVAIFTNLTRDHLDYHRDMEDYFQAKMRLFNELLASSTKPSRHAVINRDDPYGRRIEPGGGVTVWTYGERGPGSERGPDFSFEVRHQDFTGTRFQLWTPYGEREVCLPMPGRHNIYNALCAIATGLAAGASLDTCLQALAGYAGVPGRLQAVENNLGLHVFVDYAHTDDALRSVLRNLANVRASAGLRNRFITLFGCGGDRDKGKRPLMMQAAQEGSDIVVLTSDNPRTEDPMAILNDARAGSDPARVAQLRCEVDRRKAIGLALHEARPGDVVLIAGKGHETYQQIGNEKLPFSDVEVVRELLREMGSGT